MNALIIAALIALFLLCAALAGRLALLERGLRQAGDALELQLRGDSTARLALPCPDRAAEELFRAVDRLTELRREEKAAYLRQEQDLRRQIANVSHDLRTPLTSILGYVQLLKDPAPAADKKSEYLDIIEGRAKTLQTFISAFYDLSRIEGGEWPLELTPVDLARVLSDQLADSYEQLERAGLAVDAALEPALPPVLADRAAVARVFSNLLTNALRHGAGTLRVRLYRDGDRIVSSFSNPAPDMAPEDAEHVFERFFTADKARDRPGAGLGLAIVKALAQRLGCAVSARWEGGIFTVEVRWSAK